MASRNKEDNSEWIGMNPNQSLLWGMACLCSMNLEELLEFVSRYKNEDSTDST